MVSPITPSRAGSLALVGGDQALDFVNTASGRDDTAPVEHLQSSGDVVRWAAHARVLTQAEAQDMASEGLLAKALALREDIHTIAIALAARLPAPPDRIDSLARTHAAHLACAALNPIGPGFGWRWSARTSPVEAVLGPIALSAVALLQQADLARVKQCPGDKCGWLFFDATRNKSRRWCEMEICGNRAKQKRFAGVHTR